MFVFHITSVCNTTHTTRWLVFVLFFRYQTGGSHINVRTIRCAYTPVRCSPSSCWRTATKAFCRVRNYTFSRRPRHASVTRASLQKRLVRGTGTEISSSFPPTKKFEEMFMTWKNNVTELQWQQTEYDII